MIRMTTTIHYVVNARLPHVRAYGIQIAKMCEAFIEEGTTLTLVIPRTRASRKFMREENALRTDVHTVVVPGLDWYDRGRAGFLLASLVFMVSSTWYLVREKIRGNLKVIYTIDMDTFSYAYLPLFGVPCYAEMHGAKRATIVNRFFFRRAAGVIATNQEIRDVLQTTFDLPPGRSIVEENGVDESEFTRVLSKAEAPEKLSIPEGKPVALYAGRFYPWKGLDILVAAARRAPDIAWYAVGGSLEQFREFTGSAELPPNLHIVADRPVNEMPCWLACADALLVLGTRKNEQSFRFTSPMKVYEYACARRPIVASATAALQGILSGSEALFYTPDDADDLVGKVRHATDGGQEIDRMTARARARASAHTWSVRASRILSFMRN